MDKNSTSAGKMAGSVIGVAVAVAALTAGFYFYGKGGEKRRKEISDWNEQAKKDILSKIKRMKNITKDAYDKTVSEVIAKYKQVKNVDPKALQQFSKELQEHWAEISKQAAKVVKIQPIKKPAVRAAVKAGNINL